MAAFSTNVGRRFKARWKPRRNSSTRRACGALGSRGRRLGRDIVGAWTDVFSSIQDLGLRRPFSANFTARLGHALDTIRRQVRFVNGVNGIAPVNDLIAHLVQSQKPQRKHGL
jgi:hypothetical protein